MVKYHLVTLIVSAECYLEALFRVTWSLLEQEASGDHVQGCIEEFDGQNCLDSFLVGADLCKMSRGRYFLVIWEQFDLFGPYKMDKGLNVVSATICQLNPYLS